MQVATNDYSITPPSTTTTTVTPLEPSKSSTTLAQRRRIPESAEKLKLTADHLDNSSSDSSNSPTEKSHYTLFDHDNVSSTCTKVRIPIDPFYSFVSFLPLPFFFFFFSYPPFVYSSFSSVSSSPLPPYFNHLSKQNMAN